MHRCARDLMICDFTTVTAEAAPSLAPEPVMVVDPAGHPQWLIGPTAAGALVFVPASREVDDLLDDPMLLGLLADGLPGLIVGDRDTVLGLVPASVLREALEDRRIADGSITGTLGEPVDVEVPGDARDVGPLVIVCRRCGHRNTLGEYPEPDQPCATGGHPLEVIWS